MRRRSSAANVRIDPTVWAARRKEAVENANTLRQARASRQPPDAGDSLDHEVSSQSHGQHDRNGQHQRHGDTNHRQTEEYSLHSSESEQPIYAGDSLDYEVSNQSLDQRHLNGQHKPPSDTNYGRTYYEDSLHGSPVREEFPAEEVLATEMSRHNLSNISGYQTNYDDSTPGGTYHGYDTAPSPGGEEIALKDGHAISDQYPQRSRQGHNESRRYLRQADRNEFESERFYTRGDMENESERLLPKGCARTYRSNYSRSSSQLSLEEDRLGSANSHAEAQHWSKLNLNDAGKLALLRERMLIRERRRCSQHSIGTAMTRNTKHNRPREEDMDHASIGDGSSLHPMRRYSRTDASSPSVSSHTAPNGQQHQDGQGRRGLSQEPSRRVYNQAAKREESDYLHRSNQGADLVEYDLPPSHRSQSLDMAPDVSNQRRQTQWKTTGNAADVSIPSENDAITTSANKVDHPDVILASGTYEIGGNNVKEVDDIPTIECHVCNKSFAPPTYEKLCQALDGNGEPKCAKMYNKKRSKYDSAGVRIRSNTHLDRNDQTAALKVAREGEKAKMKGKGKASGRKKRQMQGGGSKWREQSEMFRNAMRENQLISKAEKEGKPYDFYLKK